jgi:hypothetical protein
MGGSQDRSGLLGYGARFRDVGTFAVLPPLHLLRECLELGSCLRQPRVDVVSTGRAERVARPHATEPPLQSVVLVLNLFEGGERELFLTALTRDLLEALGCVQQFRVLFVPRPVQSRNLALLPATLSGCAFRRKCPAVSLGTFVRITQRDQGRRAWPLLRTRALLPRAVSGLARLRRCGGRRSRRPPGTPPPAHAPGARCRCACAAVPRALL